MYRMDHQSCICLSSYPPRLCSNGQLAHLMRDPFCHILTRLAPVPASAQAVVPAAGHEAAMSPSGSLSPLCYCSYTHSVPLPGDSGSMRPRPASRWALIFLGSLFLPRLLHTRLCTTRWQRKRGALTRFGFTVGRLDLSMILSFMNRNLLFWK